jgi:predicted amidohydrolase
MKDPAVMNISALVSQFPVTFSVQENLAMMDAIVAQAAEGDLVIFPEGALSGYAADPEFVRQIQITQLPAGLDHLRQNAMRRRIHLWVGSCIQQAGQWFNAAYGFSPDGDIQIYHKINLANHERGVFTAGSSLPVFELPFQDGTVQVGVQMCRELRYPEQWGWLARRGAQVFIHLNNAVGNESLQPVWRSHLVSRAAETQRFVLSANTAAPAQICPTIAIAPDGRVIAEIVSSETGILRVDLDLAKISQRHLDQCREDVVMIRPGG